MRPGRLVFISVLAIATCITVMLYLALPPTSTANDRRRMEQIDRDRQRIRDDIQRILDALYPPRWM